MLAVFVSRLGALVILLEAVLLLVSFTVSFTGKAPPLLSIGIGLSLMLFGQVATAVFDIADHVLANPASGDVTPNAKCDPALPNRG
jgi:hypothetical protein